MEFALLGALGTQTLSAEPSEHTLPQNSQEPHTDPGDSGPRIPEQILHPEL